MSVLRNRSIPEDKLKELIETFNTIDINGNGYLEEFEVQNALEISGYKKAPYEVRELMTKYDVKQVDGRIDFSEFMLLYNELRKQDFGLNAIAKVKRRTNTIDYSAEGSDDIKHSIRVEEQVAFADWINRNLGTDADCTRYLPFHPDGRDLYPKCGDGIILCKIINISAPGTIDMRALNRGEKLSVFKVRENITLALNSALAIGCSVVNIGASDIEEGVKHLLVGLLWQIIKIGLLKGVNLVAHSELAALLGEGESLDSLVRLSPEALLIRWVNHHLMKAGCARRIKNFSEDIKDSEVYAYLLEQIAPKEARRGMHTSKSILDNHDSLQRAELVLQNADRLDARVFVSPEHIVSGNQKLNLAFVANLFNFYPALERPADIDAEAMSAVIVEETREERTYRNWMNSLGVDPFVNYLYSDLRDGIVIFQLFDAIRKGLVIWSRVHKTFSKLRVNFEILENCNYAVELGKQSRFSLVGIGGEDLRDGNVTLTLALVWQLMRAYTLSLLTQLADSGRPIDERAIVEWANRRLAEGNAGRRPAQGPSGAALRLNSFQDQALSNGHIILALIDAIRPGSVDKSLVMPGGNSEEKMSNAKLAITVARRIGANVYAMPEDITEVKSKMIMTVFACLMIVDLQVAGPGTKNGAQ